ncbi:hypothetical protein GCM10010109_00500 [Actinoplanes campanulatus]|nr:hypothetical protein GCM10010109_00500 [Actinoplanes campanulatus]GID34413.1 hypothetical protein Aca09nite_09190 [Actinoplanes campanulatus]
MVPTALRLRRSIVVVASLTVLVAGGLIALRETPAPAPAPAPRAVPRPGEARVEVGPLHQRTGALLTLSDAASRVRVRFADLPGLLYRISAAPDSGVAPRVARRGGRVAVTLENTGRDGLDEVRIVLNRDVRWDIRLPGGAGEQHLNLRDGRVERVYLGSAGLTELWLPEPVGTVPVVLAGGSGTAMLSAGGGAPFRVRFDEGAGSVRTPWTANDGTPAGTVLREPGFRRSRDRYAIRAAGGLGTLVVRRDRIPTVRRAETPSSRRTGNGFR